MDTKMNKSELINTMSQKAELSKKDTEKALAAFIETVTETLVAKEKLSLVGFGTFEVSEKAERTGTIQMGDRKGETYTTPAHYAPKLRFGKNVKDLVAQN
jgi:DNA-binding protein HU-beta